MDIIEECEDKIKSMRELFIGMLGIFLYIYKYFRVNYVS